MADLKISQLNSLAGSSLANNDVLAVVDTSASETKKITSKDLVQYGYALVDPNTLDGNVIEPGTTSARGTVQLTDSTSSTSTTTAATPNAVKGAFDLANAALPKSGGTMTGQILGDDSTSASTPGYAFDGDPDTGLLRTGANELGLVTGGTARLTIDASGNVIVPGNFTVQGTTTTIDTTTLVVEDKNIEMGAVATPSDVTADGGGITLRGTTDKTINWIDATDAWTSSERFSVPTGTAGAPSLTFTGDPNTGIYSPGADQVAISTGGSGRLFVDASGNVGVGGSPTPYGALTVFSSGIGGHINSTSGAAGINFYENGSGRFSLRTLNGSAGLSFYDTFNSTERLRITSAGLVGVGTSSPSNTLHVVGTGLIADANNGTNLTLTKTGGFGSALQLQNTSGLSSDLIRILDSSNNIISQIQPATNGINFASGRVGIGTTTVNTTLEVLNSSAPIIRVGDGLRHVQLWGGSSTQNQAVGTATAASFGFNINSSEVARFDTSGRFLVGTSSARSTATLGTNYQALIEKAGDYAGFSVFGNKANNQGSYFVLGKSRGTTAGAVNTVVADDVLGYIGFEGTDGTSSIRAADIFVAVDGTPGANDMPGRLVFSTTADGASSPTERMRIRNNGEVLIGAAALVTEGTNDTFGFGLSSAQELRIAVNNAKAAMFKRGTSDGTVIDFRKDTALVGTISVTASATAYNTSSDYRLKENVTAVTDGINRLQQLKPSRFNFIADSSRTVDGFLAHEVQDVVPEAITGEKDAVDADGNPIYQGIDQSKLVPLLTAALQEAVARIETLEAKVAALESA